MCEMRMHSISSTARFEPPSIPWSGYLEAGVEWNVMEYDFHFEDEWEWWRKRKRGRRRGRGRGRVEREGEVRVEGGVERREMCV